MFRNLKSLMIAIFVPAICLPVSLPAEVLTFGYEIKLVKYSTAELKPLQQEGLNWLNNSDHGYFGALSINLVEDTWAAVRGYNSFETARQFAQHGCKALSKNYPDQCILYASVIPGSLDPLITSASGLGLPAFKVFNGEYSRNQIAGRFGAFAISGIAEHAFTLGYMSESEAVSRAIKYCEEFAAKTVATFEKEDQTAVRKEGFDKCEVVHVTRPN